MPVVYFKRYRMQFDLLETLIPAPRPASSAEFLEWDEKLVYLHGMVKWESFRREMDVNVFPCLGDRDGCRQLMRDISRRDNFVPESTWLATHYSEKLHSSRPVGTIQGLRLDRDLGAIQNIGVIPEFRGKGIARELIRRNLCGFREVGCCKVQLEVTIHNFDAIRLYESVGFRISETVFKVGHFPEN